MSETPTARPHPPYQFASMAKRAQYRGQACDALTPEFCPCRQCHGTDRVQLTVYEATMGLCSTCLMRSCSQVRVMDRNEQASIRRLALTDAGVPPGYLGCSWDSWQGAIPGHLGEWRGVPWCVWIFGPAGTGKTHLAVSMLSDWTAEGRGSRFAISSLLLEDLKAGFDLADHRGATDVRRCRLLVLDDAFTGKESEKWGRPALCDILRARHANNAATIVTSNVPPSKVTEFDAPLASRLGEGLRVNMSDHQDYRRIKGGANGTA